MNVWDQDFWNDSCLKYQGWVERTLSEMAVFSFLEILDNLSKVGLEHFAFGTSPKSTCVYSRSTYKFLRTFGLYIYENFFHKLLDRVITSYECYSDKENCISIWRCCSNSKERIERHFGLIPMFLYQLRWNIEIGYYEQKIFWSHCSYMIRSSKNIELMLNLINISYSAMEIMPYQYPEFFEYWNQSVQDFWLALEKWIREDVFLWTFEKKLEKTVYIFKVLNSLLSKQNHQSQNL